MIRDYQNKPCACRQAMPGIGTVWVHLMGCPKDYYTQEYFAAPWYKRILMTHPWSFYKRHFLP